MEAGNYSNGNGEMLHVAYCSPELSNFKKA